jgi:hypothetical protein
MSRKGNSIISSVIFTGIFNTGNCVTYPACNEWEQNFKDFNIKAKKFNAKTLHAAAL